MNEKIIDKRLKLTRYIDSRRIEMGMSIRSFSLAMGMNKDSYPRRLYGDGFSESELQEAAKFLGISLDVRIVLD